MKIVNFEVDSNEIQIVPLADLHIGSPECDIEWVKEVCDYIAKTPNCYTIINGDVCDTGIRNSVGLFEQEMTPMNQVTTAVYYLRDIIKQGKCINITSGNHEDRLEKESGLSVTDLLLAHLMQYDETLNQRYCRDGAFTFLTMNGRKNQKNQRICFTIFNIHGNGGSTKIGNKIQRLEDLSQIVPASLYIRSHTHQPETHRGVYFEVNTNMHTVKEQPCVYVNTGAFLKYGGYGAKAGMKPLSRAVPVITLKVKRKRNNHTDEYIRQIEVVLKDSLED